MNDATERHARRLWDLRREKAKARARELEVEESSRRRAADPQEIMDLLALCDVPKTLRALVGNRILPKDRGPKKDSAQNLEKRAIAAAHLVSRDKCPKPDERGYFSKDDTEIITDCAITVSDIVKDRDTTDNRRASVKGYLADEDFRFVVESLICEFQESAFPGVDEIKRRAKLALETVAVNRLREHSRGDHTDLSEAANSPPAG